MKARYERFLARKFPHLLRDLYGPEEETPLNRGIMIGEGWFDILFQALAQLEELRVSEPKLKDLRITQIKTKFDEGRLYVRPHHELAYAISQDFTSQSRMTCYICGARATKGILCRLHSLTEGVEWWFRRSRLTVKEYIQPARKKYRIDLIEMDG